MRKRLLCGGVLLSLAVLMGGCASSYRWRSGFPASARTVSVPTFRNESNVQMLGTTMSRQLLREFQREGTFRIAEVGESAIEIQGVIKSAQSGSQAYNRRSGLRIAGYDMTARVEVSVIDKRSQKVLVDNRVFTAQTTFTAGQDLATSQRDASGRLADDLSSQVVDAVLNLKWQGEADE